MVDDPKEEMYHPMWHQKTVTPHELAVTLPKVSEGVCGGGGVLGFEARFLAFMQQIRVRTPNPKPRTLYPQPQTLNPKLLTRRSPRSSVGMRPMQ